jgi:hypothetical protein
MLKQIRIDPDELLRSGPKFIGFVVVYDAYNRRPVMLGCKPKWYIDAPRQFAPTWLTAEKATRLGHGRTGGFWAYALPEYAHEQDVVTTIERILEHEPTIERVAPDGVLWVTAPGKKSLYHQLKKQLRDRKLLQPTTK